MNFPGKSINEMELDEAIENDEEENGTDNDESDNLTNGNGQGKCLFQLYTLQ